MPTASEKMTSDLVSDFTTIGKLIVKMEKQIKGADAGPLNAAVATLRTAYDRIKPQLEKFGRGLGESPKTFPDENDYKSRRKDVTKMKAAAVKTSQAVTKWAKSAADDDDDDIVTFACVGSAVKEFVGNVDKKLAQALTMVARGESGRSGPKQDGVGKYQHIHIGGNARSNLLFTPAGVVLGMIDFHMDKSNNDSQKDKIKGVAKRSGGKTILKLEGTRVSKA